MVRAIASLAVCVSGMACVQSAVGPQFEVAAIKPSKADTGSSGLHTGHGRLTAANVTLKRCIMGAYAVGPNQIVGGPSWLDSDRWEIIAKAEEPVGDHDLMFMLQTLLRERFKLTLHRESKPIKAYVLEVGKNGIKLEKGDGQEAKTGGGRGSIVAINSTMDHFAEVLARQVDRPVLNHTGLAGVFNLKLQWTPESFSAVKPVDNSAVDGPSLFTAIQEQMGLRLRSQKEPVDVLVIDHAERPSDN